MLDMPLFAAIALLISDPFDPGPNPMLMRHPTMNKSSIVFQFAGDLWSVPRQGGEAQRLTSAPGTESDPYFSPDGNWIAFSGNYDGNTDVFVIPAKGGVPKRLTAHPAPDTVLGWTPDGKSVLFSSNMLSNTDYVHMFTVPVSGGVPKALPFPSGRQACFSPDGSKIAYVPTGKWQQAWKRYRGGQTAPIWIGQMSDSRVKEIPRQNSMDEYPMWFGDSIYYLSDKRGPVGLYRFDTKTGSVAEEIKGEGFDLKSATAGPDAIVYERLGSINIFDPKSHASKRVAIEINSDFPEVRQQFKHLTPNGLSISPSGQRVAVSARGWVFTAPASKGDARQIGEEQGLHRKNPAWSPNGKTIAFITDPGNIQRLALYDAATGLQQLKELGDAPGDYDNPVWSPDSTKIAYGDNKLNVWFIDVATGKNTRVDTGYYRQGGGLSAKWSPDSKWLTWSRNLANHYNAIFLYSTESGKVTQITDGLADATNPCFDRDGKHLYFLASTNTGLASDLEGTASLGNINVVSSVYAVVLRKDGPNPLQPESDEEGAAKQSPPAPGAPVAVKVDLDNITRRIIALPLPAQPYEDVIAGPPGSFFLLASAPRASVNDFSGARTLSKFSFADRKLTPFAAGVGQVDVTPDGSKMLLLGMGLSIVSTAMPPAPGQGTVDVSGLATKIDPQAEWRHMYHEAWAEERLLLYDPHLHGINADVMEKRYEPFLANICSRDDLNYLFTDMLGKLTVGHMFIGGGDIPGAKVNVPGGLLGADYQFENGRYRLTRIYDGELWNPGLVGPLAQPGINAQVGEYILAIDGHELTEANDIYLSLEGKARKQVKVKIGPSPDGVGAREVTVVPTASEFNLRFRAWSEDNRWTVDKMTGGRAGYVHVPDTGGGGWTEFNRYYYAQSSKDGVIVDDRFNHGGAVDDFFVREMEKPLDYGSMTRHGHDWVIPNNAIYGPKVMLVNEGAGSGGDIFPFEFRLHKVGRIIGKRTWGAMISAYGFQLLDGGSIRAPDDAMYDPKTGKWVIENEGVAPDESVELDPYRWRQGHDAQLDRAIAVINEQLKNYHPAVKRPAYPDKSRIGGG
jgi:tricorn protease